MNNNYVEIAFRPKGYTALIRLFGIAQTFDHKQKKSKVYLSWGIN